MRRLLLATTNPGKQREFRRLLAPLPAEVVTPDEIGLALDVAEPYDTYAENAAAKADAYARASGLLTLADDSGLEVAALGGGPAVRTGRWGQGDGRDADRMVDAVAGTPDRGARMVCVLAIGIPSAVGDAPGIELFDGVIDGSIAQERRGAAASATTRSSSSRTARRRPSCRRPRRIGSATADVPSRRPRPACWSCSARHSPSVPGDLATFVRSNSAFPNRTV